MSGPLDWGQPGKTSPGARREGRTGIGEDLRHRRHHPGLLLIAVPIWLGGEEDREHVDRNSDAAGRDRGVRG
jgi:hypothetical protein